MRILFYVEPHPIRGTFVHFRKVFRDFLALASENNILDARVYANRATIRELTSEEREKFKPILIVPTDDEENLFGSVASAWNEAGIHQWKMVMEGSGVANDYLKVLHDIWHRFPFDIIVHWGENGAIRQFVKELPITDIAVELGCTRPPFLDSIAIDLYGTNGNGLIPKLSIDEIDTIVAGRELPSETALLAYSESLESTSYEKRFSALSEDIAARLHANQHRKVAFLPLQLYDDANLVLFSKYDSIMDVVLDVVPKLAENGYLTLIKPHPAAKYRVNAQQENNAARAAIRALHEHFIWCDADKGNYDNSRLISMSDLVVTVNSSVGFEATYFDKPVTVLGDAAYKPKGLFPSLDAALAESYDKTAYKHGIGILRRFMLEAYLVPAKTLQDSVTFSKYISTLADFRRDPEASPSEVATRYYQSFAGMQRTLLGSAMLNGVTAPGSGDFTWTGTRLPKAAEQLVPGVNAAFKAAAIVGKLASLSGRGSKSEIVEFVCQNWLQPEMRLALVRKLELVDSEFYLSEYPDVANAHMNADVHFVLYGEAERRNPDPRINLSEFVRARNIAGDSGLRDILIDFVKNAHFLPEEAEEPSDEQESELDDEPVEEIDEELARGPSNDIFLQALRDKFIHSKSKIAVVAHLYYRDLVTELLNSLSLITEEFDLIVTLPTWGAKEMEALVLERFPNAFIFQMPNKGRDIGPFLEALPYLVEKNYQAALKLHTKKGYYYSGRMLPKMGKAWRDTTFESLLGNSDKVGKILWAFRNIPTVNMVGPKPFYVSLEEYPYADDGFRALGYLEGSRKPGRGFFAGTMFWFRPSCLAPLVTGPNALRLESFEAESGASDGQLAHLVERLFGQLAGSGTRVGAMDAFADEADLELGLKPSSVKIHDFLTGMLANKPKPEKSLLW